MTLPGSIRDIADFYWARDFACSPGALRPASTRVQAHAGELVGYDGVWILCVAEAPLVSMPPDLLDGAGETARSWSREQLFDPAPMVAALQPARVREVIGPAFIGYLTEAPRTSTALRAVTEADLAAVGRLRAACDPVQWRHGGSDAKEVPTFAEFAADGEIAALAGYETWPPHIAHITVISRPSHRGRGGGRAVVAAAAAHAMGAGLVPQYRTLVANEPSMRIAQRLGFQLYGHSLALKLTPSNPAGELRGS